MKRRTKGFSLIELLIVVAIILIVTAIAIPKLTLAKQAANEATAAQNLHAIATAENVYATTFPSIGYTNSLTVLASSGTGSATSQAVGLLDNDLAVASPTRSGFNFTYTAQAATPSTTFTIVAAPSSSSQGNRAFCIDASGLVVYNYTGTAASVTGTAGTSCVTPSGTCSLGNTGTCAMGS